MLAFAVLLMACGEANLVPNEYIKTTLPGSRTFVLAGLISPKSFTPLRPQGCWGTIYFEQGQLGGRRFCYQPASATTLSAMPDLNIEGEWLDVAEVAPGRVYWVRNQGRDLYRYLQLRIDWVEGDRVGVEYKMHTITSELPVQPNANANLDHPDLATHGLEVPRLMPGCVFAPHYVTYNNHEYMNMALEWNSTMKHSNWVCFTFNSETSLDKVSRTDAWDVDPVLPKNDQVDNSYHTNDGFDRGHICASEDRVYCNEANKQTFYFSNMSPQLNAFNGGYWAKMENLVQRWGRSTQQGTFDTLYVAKGGTLNKLLINFTSPIKGNDGVTPTTNAQGFTVKGLACPAYYYMAVLAVKDGNYQAIGLLVPHDQNLNKTPSAAELQTRAMSIAQLQEETGIDFFCNLPDDEELEVESKCDLSVWRW